MRKNRSPEINRWAKYIDDINNNNDDAKSLLYEESFNYVYFIAFQYVNNEEMALDITQDVFIKIFSNLSSLDRPKSYMSWAKTITINTALNTLKKKKPETFSSLSNDGENFEEQLIDYNTEDISKELELKDSENIMLNMINALPDKQRIAMLLFYIDGKKIAEIAHITQSSEGTVKSRLNTARKNLAELLEDKEEKLGFKLFGNAIIPAFIFIMEYMRDSDFANHLIAYVKEALAGLALVGLASMADAGAANSGATGSTAANSTVASSANASSNIFTNIATFISTAGTKAISAISIATVSVTGVTIAASIFIHNGNSTNANDQVHLDENLIHANETSSELNLSENTCSVTVDETNLTTTATSTTSEETSSSTSISTTSANLVAGSEIDNTIPETTTNGVSESTSALTSNTSESSTTTRSTTSEIIVETTSRATTSENSTMKTSESQPSSSLSENEITSTEPEKTTTISSTTVLVTTSTTTADEATQISTPSSSPETALTTPEITTTKQTTTVETTPVLTTANITTETNAKITTPAISTSPTTAPSTSEESFTTSSSTLTATETSTTEATTTGSSTTETSTTETTTTGSSTTESSTPETTTTATTIETSEPTTSTSESTKPSEPIFNIITLPRTMRLDAIAELYNVSADDILEANPKLILLNIFGWVLRGTVLNIPI